MKNKYNDKLPEVHDVLQGLRKVADQYNAVLIGETWTANIEELNILRPSNNELQMPMDFLFTTVNKLSPPEFRKQIAEVNSAPRLAGLRDQQPRHRALLQPLWRWET